MSHFAITALAVLGLAGAACSSDDEAPDPSLVAEVGAALCDIYGPAGSMVLEGRVYSMDDC